MSNDKHQCANKDRYKRTTIIHLHFKEISVKLTKAQAKYLSAPSEGS